MEERAYRRSFERLLKSCSCIIKREALRRQVNGFCVTKGFHGLIVTIANHLLLDSSRSGKMVIAQKVFDEMPVRNFFSWNTMIEGYMNSGDKMSSLKMFYMMPERNVYSWNVVVSGFAKAGELVLARRYFDAMPEKDVVTLNSLLHGYIKNGYAEEALCLFKESKLRADVVTLTTVVWACSKLPALNCGKQVHARVLIDGTECDSFMNTSLVNLYAKCGDLRTASYIVDQTRELDDRSLSALVSGYSNHGEVSEARRLFDMRRSSRCIVMWNSMISCYVANNMEKQALILFNEMRNESTGDSRTLAPVINACGRLFLLETGKQIHGHAYKLGLVQDNVIASTLLDMYSTCGSSLEACKLFSEIKTYDTILLNCMLKVYFSCGKVEEAKLIFERIENKSLISWNSMTVGLSRNGCHVEALEYFYKMFQLDMTLDSFSLSSVISSCASVSSLEVGEQVFARATVVGLDSDHIVSSSLIDLYSKCGYVEQARRVFDTTVKPDEIPWNSMISGYANNGHGLEAIDLFERMYVHGLRPTKITFLGVLKACDYCGLVEEGRRLFESMKLENGLVPEMEHFSCMVDLLSRAGYLEEALELVEGMPFDADASIWSSVLRGCVAVGDKSMGKKVAEKILEIEPENSVAYVQLAAIFANSGDWESSALVRKLMREKHLRKSPGSSWAEC